MSKRDTRREALERWQAKGRANATPSGKATSLSLQTAVIASEHSVEPLVTMFEKRGSCSISWFLLQNDSLDRAASALMIRIAKQQRGEKERKHARAKVLTACVLKAHTFCRGPPVFAEA